MEKLKEKYIRLSNIFTLGLFRFYLAGRTMISPYEIDIYNHIKGIDKVLPSDFFDDLFQYIDAHPHRNQVIAFLEAVFQELIELAKSQIQFALEQIESFEKDESHADDVFHLRYDRICEGYYCSIGELNEMIDFFARVEEFEKCNTLVAIRKKYYGIG